ncbi:MAG TPA: hypothetical protein VFV50_13950 [Bdellovibrionales bacterium]|nr:hypothetical protein [Bdellovibrionales bacterium]
MIRQLSFKFSSLASGFFAAALIFGGAPVAFAAIPKNEIQNAIAERLNKYQSAQSWREFVKSVPAGFPADIKTMTAETDKLTLELDGDTYTLGIGYRQVFMKADFERVKKLLTDTALWKDLYGLDAEATISDAADGKFRARIFKKVPVISDQDYTLEYKQFEDGGVWFQRATQAEDKKDFALRDNLKALERVDGGTLLREVSVVYILRWYLRALGPQVRSTMETEVTKLNHALKCAAESSEPVTKKLAGECWKLAEKSKSK